jgi:hypothetical protein
MFRFFAFFAFFVLVLLSSYGYSKDIIDPKVNIGECFDKLESMQAKFCNIDLFNGYQNFGVKYTHNQASKMSAKHSHFFYNVLTSDEERLNFSLEVINYLVTKGMVKPFIMLAQGEQDLTLSVGVPIAERKVGYGVILSDDEPNASALLNLLVKNDKPLTNIYRDDIATIFLVVK